MDKFIAEKKVLGTVVLEGVKSPAGNEMVEVNFEDGSKEIMPKLRYEMITTNEISDASTVQKTIHSRVSETLYATMHEYGILLGEVEEILNYVSNLTNSGYEKAHDVIWGFPHYKLPLNKINAVLLENHAKENNSGVVSKGGESNIQDTN